MSHSQFHKYQFAYTYTCMAYRPDSLIFFFKKKIKTFHKNVKNSNLFLKNVNEIIFVFFVKVKKKTNTFERRKITKIS